MGSTHIEQTNHKQNKNKVLSWFLISVLCLLYMKMEQYLGGVQLISPFYQFLLTFALIVFAIFASILCSYHCTIRHAVSVLGTGVLFYLLSLMSSLLNLSMYSSFIQSFCSQSFWFACFLFFSVFVERRDMIDFDAIVKILNTALLVFTARYFIWVVTDSVEVSGSVNCVYYGLLLLPCIFMTKKIIFKVGVVGLAMIGTLLSAKRTAFLILLVALAVPLLFELFGRAKKKTLVTILIGIVVIILLYNHISETYELTIFDRFETIEEDKGSGRFDIYEEVLSSFKNSRFVDRLLGHGFNAVSLRGASWTSAHNDFLEVLYDFGYVGVTVYIVFVIKLIVNAFRLYKYRSSMASTYTSALIMFLIMSLSSHLILYPTYIVFLLLFFVLGISDLNRIKRGS